jgi:ferrochelatase
MSIVKRGDPYPAQIRATVDGIHARVAMPNPWALSFQSKVGPIKWLEPSTEAKTVAIAREGHRTLLVMPVSFVSDHIETLHELDIDLQARARAHGIERFVRAPALNDGADFLDALADVARKALAPESAPASGTLAVTA